MVCGVHGAQPEGTFDVYLSHLCLLSHAHDGVDGIIHCGVAELEVSIVDAIVNTATWGKGKVHDEMPFP